MTKFYERKYSVSHGEMVGDKLEIETVEVSPAQSQIMDALAAFCQSASNYLRDWFSYKAYEVRHRFPNTDRT